MWPLENTTALTGHSVNSSPHTTGWPSCCLSSLICTFIKSTILNTYFTPSLFSNLPNPFSFSRSADCLFQWGKNKILPTNLLTFCAINRKPYLPFYIHQLGGPCILDVTSSGLLSSLSPTNVLLISAWSLLKHFRQHFHMLPSVVHTFSFTYYIISLLSLKSPITSTLSNPMVNFYSPLTYQQGLTCDHCFLLNYFFSWLLDNTLSLSSVIPGSSVSVSGIDPLLANL